MTGRLLALLVALAAPAAAQPVDEVVAAMEKQAILSKPLRADLEVEIDTLEGKRADRGVLLHRPAADGKGVDTYLELADAKLRYLVLADGSAWIAEDGKVSKAGLDTAIAGSAWVVEDLLPFSTSRCEIRRTVSTLGGQFSFLCESKGPAQYALTVYKVDPGKAFPHRVMRYQERQDNLVKMLRNDELEAIGGKWRPGRMEMENFKLRTKDVFVAKWSEAANVPADAFDPKGFASARIPAAK